MTDERTNEELADGLASLQHRLNKVRHLKYDERALMLAAASRLRAMKGKRIEGIVVEETKDGSFHRIVFEERHSNMADLGRYARATLIFHKTQEQSDG